jgi:hypothetical protein
MRLLFIIIFTALSLIFIQNIKSESSNDCIITPESVGAVRISDAYNIKSNKKALDIVIRELENDGENPYEYYVQIEKDNKEKVSIHLWHQISFDSEHCNVLGNPSGKNKTFIVDLKNKNVIEKQLWQ